MRTIVLAPTGRDAQLIASLLIRLGKPCHIVGSAAELNAAILDGAGAAIVAEEALRGQAIELLQPVLAGQPSWSDFPLILLVSGGRVTAESEQLRRLRLPLGNVLLLERPLRPETLLSTLEMALRGRERQYQVRDQMEQVARAQEALRRSEKLAVTGRMAASIAHEINNPLEAVTNLLYLIRLEVGSDLLREYLDHADQELARVTEITKHTLRFYREPNQPIEIDPVPVLESVLTLFHSRLAAAHVAVQKEFLPEPVSILANPGELRQIFANIIGNALDAMRHGGRLRLRLSREQTPHEPKAHRIRLSIADTGSGISPELLPTIFEPFITTKGETGTGLGLWVTEELVRKNGWAIRVHSCTKPGRTGTAFSLLFPLQASESGTY